MTDRATLSAAALATALRRWLHARREDDGVQAAALAYETAALIARNADTRAQAFEVVDAWAVSMKEQIDRLGVGVEHP